jgi:hypothetical protein
MRSERFGRSKGFFLLSLITYLLSLSVIVTSFAGCDNGTVGGADQTFEGGIAATIDPWCGVWYSHYGGRKLDGYRIGKWKDFAAEMAGKLALFPDYAPHLYDNYAIQPDDYYLFSDDTVYETTPGDGGNGGWGGGMVTRYIGIVRAVNVFQTAGSGAGAVIIEYLDGCYPTWDADIPGKPLPFFGMYYRVLNADCIQMANAVKLWELAHGKKYYTETATLAEAVANNNAENDGEYIAWGVVIPQDRE